MNQTAISLVLIALGLAPALAQGPVESLIRNQNLNSDINKETTFERYAISGRKTQLGYFYALKLNCTPVEWQEVSIIKEPEHGKATLSDQKATVSFPTTSPRSTCNGKSTLAKVLEYTPTKDYKGPDEVVAEQITSTGQKLKFTYTLVVK